MPSIKTHLLTAEEARTRYKPPYTLQAILDHVTRNCSYSQEIYGYELDRTPPDVLANLNQLGYQVLSYFDNDKRMQCIKISWKEEK